MPVTGIQQLIQQAQSGQYSPKKPSQTVNLPTKESSPPSAPPANIAAKPGGNMIGSATPSPVSIGHPFVPDFKPGGNMIDQVKNPFTPPAPVSTPSVGYTNPFSRPDAKASKPDVQPTQPKPSDAITTRDTAGFRRQDILSRLTVPVEQAQSFIPQEFSKVGEQFATDMFGDRERMLRFFTRFRDYFQPRGLPTDNRKKVSR